MTIWRWRTLLDGPEQPHQITLGEGDTPLLRSRRLGPSLGIENLWFKLETSNPSGSFKDRFAAAAVSHMLARGQRRCVATSSGNTGAALAAYCAAAGVACEIAVVETAPESKLHQMRAYGANIFRVRGFGIDPQVTADALACIERMGQAPETALQISAFKYSADGMKGVRSIAYEVAQQASRPVDHVFCPAGGGGLAMGVAQGFEILKQCNEIERGARVEVVQPTGNNTIAGPLRDGAAAGRPVDCTTKVSGLQVASVVDANETIGHCRASGGSGHLVEDERTWEVQRRLAVEEGVFSEPAGAISVAAAIDAVEQGRVQRDAMIVCLVTGSAFKDPPSLARMASHSECPLIDTEELRRRAERS